MIKKETTPMKSRSDNLMQQQINFALYSLFVTMLYANYLQCCNKNVEGWTFFYGKVSIYNDDHSNEMGDYGK